jgi:hypothetical protein
MVDAQFADSLSNRLHIPRIPVRQTVQARCDQNRARSSLSRMRHLRKVSVCLNSIMTRPVVYKLPHSGDSPNREMKSWVPHLRRSFIAAKVG